MNEPATKQNAVATPVAEPRTGDAHESSSSSVLSLLTRERLIALERKWREEAIAGENVSFGSCCAQGLTLCADELAALLQSLSGEGQEKKELMRAGEASAETPTDSPTALPAGAGVSDYSEKELACRGCMGPCGRCDE